MSRIDHWWKTTAAAAVIVVAMSLMWHAAPAAQQTTTGGAAATPSFKSETELVVLNVVVRDRRGAYVEGLPRDAFRVLENGMPRDIGLFTHQEAPVTIGLVIDASGSMSVSRARLAFAASRFADTGNPEDEVFALVVGDIVRPVLPPERPFTSDPAVLQHAIQAGLNRGGRTALWDGVAEGLRYLARGTHARRALVVISDAHDNRSRHTFDDVLVQTQASNAAVYTIGLIDPADIDRRPRSLRTLAEASGGDVFYPETHTDALRALEEVAREIRSAYTIGFTSPTSGRDGAYHRLRVEVTGVPGKALKVRTRAGYLAGMTAASNN